MTGGSQPQATFTTGRRRIPKGPERLLWGGAPPQHLSAQLHVLRKASAPKENTLVQQTNGSGVYSLLKTSLHRESSRI